MALSIFEKADPDLQKQKDAETALRTRRRDRDALNEKLGIAEAAIANYRAKARQLAAEGGDDKAISAAEASKRSSEDRVATLTGALADVDAAIIKLEAQIAAVIDRRCRIETAAAVSTMADRIARAQKDFDVAAAELEDAAKEALIIPESVAVSMFVGNARTQLVPAVAMVVGALQAHGKGVLNGTAPASLPRPAAPPVALKIVPAEPTMNIFVLKNLKYVAADGKIVTLGRCKRHYVPQHLAELALSSPHIALAISDPRCRDLGQSAAPYVPTEQSCEWLGPKGKEAGPVFMRPGGAVVHSQFEPVDRGQPYTVMVPRQEPVAMGARSLPEGSDET